MILGVIDDLVNRGHRFHDLINSYPLRLVLSLHKAVRQNRSLEMVAMANAISAGVSNSLDLAFNLGKGNIMKRYSEFLLKVEAPEKKPPRVISERAAAFLSGLPVCNKVSNV